MTTSYAIAGTLLYTLISATNTAPAGWDELTPLGIRFEDKNGFERIAEHHGVTVYKDRDADVIRLAAGGTLNANPDEVLHALIDYDHQVGVIARVLEIKILERGPSHLVVYQRLSLPVIDDRDYVLKVTWGTTGGVRWIRYWALEGTGPAGREGVVRVVRHDGSWQISPLEDGTGSKVRYQVRIDLGGLLPKWMAKAAAGKEVPLVFTDVCKMLSLNKPEVKLCLR